MRRKSNSAGSNNDIVSVVIWVAPLWLRANLPHQRRIGKIRIRCGIPLPSKPRPTARRSRKYNGLAQQVVDAFFKAHIVRAQIRVEPVDHPRRPKTPPEYDSLKTSCAGSARGQTIYRLGFTHSCAINPTADRRSRENLVQAIFMCAFYDHYNFNGGACEIARDQGAG